jgi:hypothetical protein
MISTTLATRSVLTRTCERRATAPHLDSTQERHPDEQQGGIGLVGFDHITHETCCEREPFAGDDLRRRQRDGGDSGDGAGDRAAALAG